MFYWSHLILKYDNSKEIETARSGDNIFVFSRKTYYFDWGSFLVRKRNFFLHITSYFFFATNLALKKKKFYLLSEIQTI